MMKPSTLYVPVLRTAAAEIAAVKLLSSDVRNLTAPLFEVSAKWAADRVDRPSRAVAKDLLTLLGSGTVYLDATRLCGRNDVAEICAELERLVLAVHGRTQLVFSLKDLVRRDAPVSYARRLLERNGAAFRVRPSDYSDPALSGIRSHFRRLGVSERSVDLIVDCQVVEDGQPMRTAQMLEEGFDWRTLTYVGGSFPENLTALKKNEQHELPRHEWLAFDRELEDRPVRFGDYTIQHPHQPDPPLQFLPSGSIRYASDQYWVVMRGEKLNNPDGPGYEQYIGQAQLLCDRPEFRGGDFSAGDEYIARIAREAKSPGNPTTWLRAGMNHHMTLVVSQLVSKLAA